MLYLIVTTNNARLDIQDAIDWEDKRMPGLAIRFLTDLEQKLSIISNSPYIYSIRYENVRCAATNTFQYLIHYIIDDESKQIIILRVLHTSRTPVW